MEYLPIITAVYHKEYNLFCDEEKIGYIKRERIPGTIFDEDIFVINGKTYLLGRGNTGVIRPFKKYKWPIKYADDTSVAIIKQQSGNTVSDVEVYEEIELAELVLMVMFMDIQHFSYVAVHM